MQILFAGAYDWANASNRIARGINAAANKRIARVLTTNRHPFCRRFRVSCHPVAQVNSTRIDATRDHETEQSQVKTTHGNPS